MPGSFCQWASLQNLPGGHCRLASSGAGILWRGGSPAHRYPGRGTYRALGWQRRPRPPGRALL